MCIRDRPFAEGTTVNSFAVDTISFAVLFAAQMLSLAIESKMAVVSVRVDTTNLGAVLADLPGYSDCSFTDFCCNLGQGLSCVDAGFNGSSI